MMHKTGKSYTPIVATTPANNADGRPAAAERVESRGVPHWNLQRNPKLRAQLRTGLQEDLLRVRQFAATHTERLTTLWHHVYHPDRLAETFFALRKDGATGVDKVDWRAYAANLEANIRDLSDRLRRGAYHAPPVRRVYIPKPDGTTRPLGIPTLEDKLVQRATADVLNAVYEQEFLDCSYGFRPGRNPHQALDRLTVTIEREKVNWVLDLDIRAFFDSIDHDYLLRCVERRIADTRVIRHLKKWLKAGVLEKGEVQETETGTPQGGSISPLLGNIFLHYALDTWAERWINAHATGYVKFIRYADDVIVCFQYRHEAEHFLAAVCERLAQCRLEVHPTKTRLIEFGRFAQANRRRRGLPGNPETFNFLGFTHLCSTTRQGWFCVRRKTQRTKMQAKLTEIAGELRRRLHAPVPATGKWLERLLKGYYQYYAVPRNLPALSSFRLAVVKLWKTALGRRSEKGYINWTRMTVLEQRWLPNPTVQHPYPNQRLTV